MPVVVGYIRRYPFMSNEEVGLAQQTLAAVARTYGYTLGTVYVEELPTDPQAFESLVKAVKELRTPAVIVQPNHLGDVDEPQSKWNILRRETDAVILVADST